MIDTQAIKERISCIDYAKKIGLQIYKSGDRCISPLRSEAQNNTSFVVYDDFFYDFAMAQGGDVIDFCALYAYGGDKGKAIKELAKTVGLENNSRENNDDWREYTQDLCNNIAYWHSKLTEKDFEYLNSRRISKETIDELMLGRTDEGRLSIPYFKNGYVSYYCTRYMKGGKYPDCKYKKQKIDGMCENIIWGLNSLNRDKSVLVIAEGAFDVMSFYQENYACISAITGFFSKKQLSSLKSICSPFDKVFLVYDNDLISKAGEKFTIKMANFLLSNKIPFIVGEVPKGFKDVSEYYSAGFDLSKLINAATDGIQFMCSTFDVESDFEKFIRQQSRYMSKTDVQKAFAFVSKENNFDDEWLNVLKKECMNCPSENYILDNIIKKYKLKYNPKIGFYEYNGKFWKLLPDESIKNYISDELGIYRTGTKCNSILNLVKAHYCTEEVFNQKPLLNFINGCLELEPTIKFREHSENDLVTYCLDYPYTPKGICPKWEEFLKSITDYDEKKISVLQELCGYVLYPTNNILQKSACFIGSGANGKSVFLNILTKVFGETNVSNVEMSSLVKDFNAIHLMGAMINISAETKSNVNGAESIFKQIVVGDEISDCYKGKDKIKFRPRAKMFVACNEFMESRDTTDGWLRRFLFVDFPCKFVENPQKPYEKKINKNIENELSEELSGIFNWILQGYIMLKQTGEFTETNDNQNILESYKETINPLIVFVKEIEFPDYKISLNDLYQDYKLWCDNCNHKALSKTQFSKKIKNLIEQYRTDLKPYRTGDFRGYAYKN